MPKSKEEIGEFLGYIIAYDANVEDEEDELTGDQIDVFKRWFKKGTLADPTKADLKQSLKRLQDKKASKKYLFTNKEAKEAIRILKDWKNRPSPLPSQLNCFIMFQQALRLMRNNKELFLREVQESQAELKRKLKGPLQLTEKQILQYVDFHQSVAEVPPTDQEIKEISSLLREGKVEITELDAKAFHMMGPNPINREPTADEVKSLLSLVYAIDDYDEDFFWLLNKLLFIEFTRRKIEARVEGMKKGEREILYMQLRRLKGYSGFKFFKPEK